MELSIIIPVLDEERLLAAFLRHLRRRAPDAELIVVDGGSRDASARISGRLADQTVHAPRGRAAQMNAGARAATGETLLFLHADSWLPDGMTGSIATALAASAVAGGCFRLRFPRRALVYRISDSLGNFAVDLFQIALGDHGIFCRRAAFEAVGGYRDVPLLEDAQLYRALRRVGRMRQLRAEIVSSPRRYEQLGPWRTTLYYAVILALYVAGARIETLHRLYRTLTEPRVRVASHSRRAVLRPASAR